MAFDAMPEVGLPPEEHHKNLINALLKFAAELPGDLGDKLNLLIENNTDPRAAVAKDDEPDKDGGPMTFEEAMQMLKKRGVDQKILDEALRLNSLSPKSQAQDARIRARRERGYDRQFPNASRIASDAAPARVAPRLPSSSVLADYDRMFPHADRLR